MFVFVLFVCLFFFWLPQPLPSAQFDRELVRALVARQLEQKLLLKREAELSSRAIPGVIKPKAKIAARPNPSKERKAVPGAGEARVDASGVGGAQREGEAAKSEGRATPSPPASSSAPVSVLARGKAPAAATATASRPAARGANATPLTEGSDADTGLKTCAVAGATGVWGCSGQWLLILFYRYYY